MRGADVLGWLQRATSPADMVAAVLAAGAEGASFGASFLDPRKCEQPSQAPEQALVAACSEDTVTWFLRRFRITE